MDSNTNSLKGTSKKQGFQKLRQASSTFPSELSEIKGKSLLARWQYIGVFLGICLVYLFTLTDVDFYRIIDGRIMFETAVSLHEFGELGISREFDGLYARAGMSDHYGKYGIGLSIVQQAPLLFVPAVERVFGEGSSNIVLAMTNLLLTAVTALLVAFCLRELGLRFRTSALAAFAFAFGTFAWPYISYDFSEPLQEFCLIAAFWLVLRAVKSKRGSPQLLILAGFILGFSVLTKASILTLIPSYVFYLWFSPRVRVRDRRSTLALFLFPVALWLAGIVLLNQHRFGSALDFGYGKESSRFTTPLLEGLYGLLLSPNKGVILYAPLVLLIPWSLWKMKDSHRIEVFFFISVFGLHTLVSAKWWSWEGGESWGPRLLLPIVPLIVVCAAMLLEPVKWSLTPFVVCALAGIGMNVLGLLLYFPVWPVVVNLNSMRLPLNAPGRPASEYLEQDGKRMFRPSTAINYVPALSPILGQAWLLRLRYFDRPFSLRALDANSSPSPPTIDYPPIEINFALLKDPSFISQLRSAHFWLWRILLRRPRDEIFSYPAYGLALEHQGDRAVAQNNLPRAIDCYRRATDLMPDNAISTIKLSDLQLKMGATWEARQSLTRFLTHLNETRGKGVLEIRQLQERAVRVRLGRLCEEAGDRDAALAEYRLFLTLHPSDQDRTLIEQRIARLASSPSP